MLTFLEETLLDISEKHKDLSKCTLILPSKRAGGFLKSYLLRSTSKPAFAPTIISIEEFIETLSNLSIIKPDVLLIKSYQAYLETTSIPKKDSFSDYCTWANSLLNDFSEIDRYMVDPAAFFDYLSSLKTLENWGASQSQTPLIQEYLAFWNHLHDFYTHLNDLLQKEQLGYQGMVYRKAAEDIEHYIASKGEQPHIFIGFNALNIAEQQIIQSLLEQESTSVYWDTDNHFFNDKEHSASLFIRNYLSSWNYYSTQSSQIFPDNFIQSKKIKIISSPSAISQVKHLGHMLSSYSQEKLNNTAIVLADEALLTPVLYSLPSNVNKANITMGLSLQNFEETTFFELLIRLHLKAIDRYYYKDVIALLNHPLLQTIGVENQALLSKISEENRTFVTATYIASLASESTKQLYELLFGNWQSNTQVAISRCREIIQKIAENKPKSVAKLVLKKLDDIFHQIAILVVSHDYLGEIKTLFSLFKQLSASDSLDFEGDAYDGLQIMGVLETRVLDFKHVIMLSVNEGVLPTGKSTASFITYDLKMQFGLPPYTEKDAVYTYHFYRLLQRAKEVTLLYSSYSNGLTTGEKSRYLLQMEIDNLPEHELQSMAISSKVQIKPSIERRVAKTPDMIQTVSNIAKSYFSPSSLTSYVRNPLDFYYQKILKINEAIEVEETVAHNTLGTIVHGALENLYRPYEGVSLSEPILFSLKKKVPTEVTGQFQEHFKEGSFTTGKNLIIYEVAQRYVHNLIDLDRSELKQGNTITLIKLEARLKTPLNIPELNYPVFLGGTVDRIDRFNDTIRVIDYKTGNVTETDLVVASWSMLGEDYKFSKAFQVLAYSLLICREMKYNHIEAGVISFKNLSAGFLKFAKREGTSRNKETSISEEILTAFETELKKLIIEIGDPSIPFIEKAISQ